MKVLKRLIRV